MNIVKVILIFVLGLIAVAFIQCSSSPSYDHEMDDYEKERMALKIDLENMKDHIDRSLENIRLKMDSSSEEGKIRFQVAYDKLLTQRTEVVESLAKVQESVVLSSEEAKQSTRNRFSQIKEGLSKTKKDLKDMFGKKK